MQERMSQKSCSRIFIANLFFLKLSMPIFHYQVSATDTFNASDYPQLAEELAALTLGIRFMPGYGKVQATVSFLKDHSINTDFVRANPVLVDMIRFGRFKTGCIELMFESCRNNPVFMKDFEKYVYESLNEQFD